jgi:hypothetical protein
MEMGHFKTVITFALCMLSLALASSSAQARWTVESKALGLGQVETVDPTLTEALTLEGKFLGTEVKLTASGLKCSGLCDIEGIASGADYGIANLTLTGVTYDKPAGCTGPKEVTLNTLTTEVIMDPSGGSRTFEKLFTDSGQLAEVTLSGACAIAGTPFPVQGTLTVEAVHKNAGGETVPTLTGEQSVAQEFVFSAAAQTTGGGLLKIGKEAAVPTGRMALALSGPNTGRKWGADGPEEPKKTQWTIEGSALPVGQSETLKVAAAEPLALSAKVLGSEIQFTASGLKCATTCDIDGVAGSDHGEVGLTLTGFSIDKPVGCTVPKELTLNPLTTEVVMDPSGGVRTFDKFFTESGPLVEFSIGGTCSLSGTTFPITGTITAEAVHKNGSGITLPTMTGEQFITQEFVLSAAAQTTGGGLLTFGKEAAVPTGRMTVALSGPNTGRKWGAD